MIPAWIGLAILVLGAVVLHLRFRRRLRERYEGALAVERRLRDATERALEEYRRLSREDLEKQEVERTPEADDSAHRLEVEISVRKEAERALRSSERRYRKLVELSPDGILVHRKGAIDYANSAAASLIGVAEGRELVGRPVVLFLHPAFGADDDWDADSSGALKPRRREGKLLRVDGTPVDVEMVSMSLSSPEGPAVQTILRDISERKRVERMKDDFISVVSHELRTPLTSIRGSLGLLAAESTPAAHTHELAAIALRNTDRLLKLVNQILDLSKLEQGRMSFDPEPRAVLPIVRQALEANRGFGEAFGVKFRLEEPYVDGVAAVDADRLQQVLANLLSNAAKYSRRGEDVGVSVRAVRNRLEIAVTNRGPGIPREFQEHIFEKFQTADASDSRRIEGTGLGLAISRGIVEAHGGRIGFETGPETTTFRFDLPLVSREAAS